MSGSLLANIRSRIRALSDDDLMRRIASGSIWSLLIKLASAVLTFAMFAALARTMSIEEFGRFGFAFSLATFLAVAANPGLHTAILRWIPEYEAKGQKDTARQALRWSTTIAGACGLAMAAVMAIAVAALPIEGPISYLFVAAAFVPPFLLAEYIGSVLRAKGSVFWAQLPRDIVWRVAVLASLGLLLFSDRTLSARDALWLITACLVIAILPQALRALPIHYRKGEAFWPPKAAQRDFRSQLLPYWGPSTIYAATQYVDTVLVGAFVSTDEAGAYFAAARIAALASLMLAATNMISAPLIARAFHGNDPEGLSRTLRLVSLCISIPTVGVVLVVIAFGPWLLAVFDPVYAKAYPVLIVLLMGHAINGLSGPTSYLLQMTGLGSYSFRIIAVSYAIGLIAQLVLIQIIGPIGAAIGGACAMAAWSLTSRAVAIRKLSVDPSALSLFNGKA